MKNPNKIILFILLIFAFLFSCSKESGKKSDLDILRNNNNRKSYPVTKMDSAQAINTITRQKIQELLDLSTLYTSGNRDTEIDSVIYSQMLSYFLEQDSSKLWPILTELDSMKVQSAKVGDITVSKKIKDKDTLDFATFWVEYFDRRNKSLGSFEKTAQYVLKPAPVKFKKEFKFYFVKFNPLPKDTASSGVIR